MNIRKKLAVAAAVALPLSGLAVVGGVTQLASAGGPPVLECSSLGADTAPGDVTGGVTFDNGSGAATAGLDLGASFNQAPVSSLAELGMGANDNTIVIPNEAIAGQQITFSSVPVGDPSTFTVVSDTVQHTGIASTKNFETAVLSPNNGPAPIAKKSIITISPSTTGTYNTYSNTSVSSGSNIVTATTNEFTGDIGQPITVAWNDSGSLYSPFQYPGAAGNPALVETSYFISNVLAGGTEAVISEYTTPAGVPLNSAITSTNSQVTSPVVVTVGSTAQTTGTVGTDYDFALTGCQTSLAVSLGVIFPNNVTFTDNGPVSNPSAAIALEAGVKNIDNANVNFPTGLPSGYSWGGGGANSTQVSFDSLKDTLNLSTDAESFVHGTVPPTDPYTTSKASMTFGVGSMVVCTNAQLQAIGTGTGGSGIDHGSIPAATNTGSASTVGSVSYDALHYCDGGTLSALTPSQAFDELAVVEAAPNANQQGSDGTALGAIWQVGGTGSAIL